MHLAPYWGVASIVSSFGSNDITSRKESSPDTKCSVCYDSVITWCQDAKVKSFVIFLPHILLRIVESKSYITVIAQIILGLGISYEKLNQTTIQTLF